ncbi:signal transduction histidine kinase [Novosphingobium capsulatum]|uniref:histidine kinase n=1 Tax=Novosphingobium capsulatum TaxID=13688 RepID=A0ABU1MGV1_9SPHN|nr:HAMP domain-containing sensor histidine kinase [Novosphingobium capsulatum]MDR6509573.1 signal transduction histidine kinase [Novosphingobium capsulatum]
MATADPIHARCDAADTLVAADEALARLQIAAGGTMPGMLAVPALLALVRQVRDSGLAQARPIVAMDGDCAIAFHAQATPDDDGIALVLRDWRRAAAPDDGLPAFDAAALWHHLAQGHVLLDEQQRVITADLAAADLAELAADLAGATGRHWALSPALSLGQGRIETARLHWRLLDDMVVDVAGSARRWRVRLLPRVGSGFDLLLLPETILALPADPLRGAEPAMAGADAPLPPWTGFLGRDLAPALRQPISRIIANAETIRSRLAGPLADAYGNYAADIAEAGRHLLGLVEDLADLDAVEAPGFAPAPDHIDLADCARRAAGILSVRARERGIALALPEEACHAPAIGEFRRVLQVLLNLLSNAIRYTPAHATVTLACGVEGATAWIAVEDRGEGLTADQAARVFEKFERLGRSGDGGSGLGLYISRRLARAMAGDLTVSSTPGEGARFVLTLPADLPSAGIVNAR